MSREVLIKALSCLPTGPGVYRMQGANGHDLYIGKAKNIAKRVAWYTQEHRLPYRLQCMVHHVNHVAVITTTCELDALLLEAQLIKQHQPPYNIVLKHSTPLLYLALSQHPYPRLMAKRHADTSASLWKIGPFLSRRPLRAVMDMIHQSFQLRSCSDTVFAQRQRPCLQYFINRCSAPCVGKISLTDYGACVEHARHWLDADLPHLKKTIEEAMRSCAQRYDFVQAKRLRDQYQALEHMNPSLLKGNVGTCDVIGWAQEHHHGCLHVVSCRDGATYVCETWFHEARSHQEGPELLSAFIQQFYARIPPPPKIVVPFEPARIEDIRALLKHYHQRMPHLVCSKRGVLAQWTEQANQQALDALRVHVAQIRSQKSILEQVSISLGGGKWPYRVEMFDNSHHQGAWAVGAMVVKQNNEWARSEYKSWDFPPCQDDYAMMREVMQARFTQIPPIPDPDLMIIDGGLGQLSAVSKTLASLGRSHIPHVSIAKSHPHDSIILSDGTVMDWPPHHPLIRWVQELRNEAHRFAISTHRRQHRHSMTRSTLEQIPGMGPKRLHTLYQAFPSIEAIKNASLQELEAVLPNTIAQRLHLWIKQQDQGNNSETS